MTMNSSEFGNLRDGWAETRLPEIALINPKPTAVLDDELDVSFLPMKAVEAISGRADLSEERRIREVRKGYTCFCNGDVLWAKITPCMENGKAAVVRNLKNGVGFGSTEFHVLRPLARRVLAEWLFFFLIQQSVRRDARKNMTGSAGQLRVPTTYLADLALPLPSLVEQRAIVAKIEALFSELDKGVEQLQTIKQQLKQYRQAVLKAAFEGKLTAAWRAERQAAGTLSSADELLEQIKKEREESYRRRLLEWKEAVDEWEAGGGTDAGRKRPAKPVRPEQLPPFSHDDLTELPCQVRGWACERLGNVLHEFFDGPFGTNLKTRDYVESGVLVVRLENIGVQSYLGNKQSFVTEGKYQELKKHHVSGGDIIFSSFVADEVRACVLPDQVHRAINKADCFCLRPVPSILNVFLCRNFSQRYFYLWLVKHVHGATRPRVNTTQLREAPVPICSTEEQWQIMREIDSRFSVLDELERAADYALNQTDELRQSILKKAFEGRLLSEAELAAVRSDPGYEPADELLERIAIKREFGGQASGSEYSGRRAQPKRQSHRRGNTADARSEAR